MTSDTLLYSVADRVATLTLNRPDQLNAMTLDMIHGLAALIDRADADDAVRAIVVTGSGRAFCAGADLSGSDSPFASAEAPGEPVPDAGGVLTLRIHRCRKPVIAALNGSAAGVGVTLTLAMDARFAAEGARFALPFVRRGIVPESASSWFLPRIVGLDRALDWCLSGRSFDAAEALQAGLVRSLHPAGEVLAAAQAHARSLIEATSPVSVALTRQLLWRMATAAGPEEAHRVESRLIAARARSADMREGVDSFLQKRAPRFPDTVSRDLPPGWPD
ncbi:enoyl-CoA hydratase-related protein [Ramlibacter sp.]|uniref:enoyl-CoA hydratase-related protein n=1 Tax=Ramlibacter sp. TaxID=1917967 RepID=UPI0035B1F2BB